MPICRAVDDVVNGARRVDEAILSLLARPFTREK
jgi:glycerol-3-phosphate dehydrogenase